MERLVSCSDRLAPWSDIKGISMVSKPVFSLWRTELWSFRERPHPLTTGWPVRTTDCTIVRFTVWAPRHDGRQAPNSGYQQTAPSDFMSSSSICIHSKWSTEVLKYWSIELLKCAAVSFVSLFSAITVTYISYVYLRLFTDKLPYYQKCLYLSLWCSCFRQL
jgi:hypothetical protein